MVSWVREDRKLETAGCETSRGGGGGGGESCHLFQTSPHLQLPNFTLCPDISLSPNLAPASQSSRLPLPGGEGSPKSVPVGFHLDIYPQPLLFRPGGEFIVGSRANIPPPASSSSTRGRCWVSSCVCQWNTEAGY